MYSLILHGRRFCELQKWRNLRVSITLLQNASPFSNSFSSACALDYGRKGKSFTISYLIDSLGLTSKLAESISSKVKFENKGTPDSVLNLLRSFGFTNSHISIIITNYPLILIADAVKSIGPKLKFLQSRGASSTDLTEVITKVPKILGIKEDKTIARYYDFVKEIIEADKSPELRKLCHNMPQGCKQDNIIRNVLVLRDLGVPQKRLFPLLISYAGPVSGKERFQESLKKVVEMGFDPTAAKFVLALRVVYGSNDKTMEEKMDVYERLGLAVADVWEMFKECPESLGLSKKKIENSIETFLGLGFSKDEFLMMIKRHPACIGYSSETVKKKTEFFLKKMNWSVKALASNPAVFGYSLEKRIVPRCNVIKALMSRGLLGSKLPSLSSVLAITDQCFLKKFVMKHDNKQLVPELITIFNKDRVSLNEA